MEQIKINGLNINYRKEGDGQPLVLMHGMLGDITAYKEFINILSDHYTVYAFDVPLFGKSDRPKDYMSVSDLADVLDNFIIDLKIEKPIICAHSASSFIAIDYASRKKIDELVLIDPAGIQSYHSAFRLLVKILFVRILKSIYLRPSQTFNSIKVGSHNLFRNFRNKNFWRLLKENMEKDCLKDIQNLSCHITVIWAKSDEIFRFNNAIKLQLINQCEIIPVDGTHYWPSLRPKEILKYIDYRNKRSVSKD